MPNKAVILVSCCNLSSLSFITTASCVVKTSPTRPRAPAQPQQRQYAMISDGFSRNSHGSVRWPEKTSVNGIPTPYQIFDQKRGSKYSKARFYELVKIYHPDRHDHTGSEDGGLSYSTKLERYRLVVAANDILSDPARRGAYDRYGAGWNGAPDIMRPRDPSEPDGKWGDYSGRGWTGGPDGPSNNATWEDWERWHMRDAQGPQSPRFVSNTTFVFLIVFFAVVGGFGQATRVGNYSANFLEQRDALHSDISKDLMRRRKETFNAFGSRDERIQDFLKQRAPLGYGSQSRDDGNRKLLPAPPPSHGTGALQGDHNTKGG